jgi:hypothetical protein
MRISTPWIYTPKFDWAAIIGPPVAVTLLVLIFGKQLEAMDSPLWLWVLLVIGIDVSHVYSSLFRTYFDREEFSKRRKLYLMVPLLSWGIGVLIYGLAGPVFFWACVAYFAIYHFVRQQYGFFMLYRRGEATGTWEYRLDQLVIYLATVYPLVYWHTYPRAFQWFEYFEVAQIPVTWPELALRIIYIACLVVFTAKELWKARASGRINLGKMALLYATAAAWATGIVMFNGDLTFALINIVSHGIPYMALVWIYQYRKRARPELSSNPFMRFFQWRYVPLYVAALFLLAFFEEGLWDWFVWKEHGELFGGFHMAAPATFLMILVPLLTMPQVTHYVLDAFIWRVSKKGHEEVRAVIG